MNICVIIPMYGKPEYTKKCVDTVLENSGFPVDIVVVDDGSETPFEDSRVSIKRLEKNSGFTNACNEGLLLALEKGYNYAFLLNNDTEVYPNCLPPLIDVLEADSQVGIASSVRIHNADGYQEVELYGIDLLRGYQAVTKIEDLKDEVIQCNWVPLCAGLVRLSMVRYLGLLDKRMVTHSSDLDYCIKAKINDYNIVVVTRSRVLHHHGVTTKEHKISPEHDQKVLLEKLSAYHYAQFMKQIPLDHESKTYGKLDFIIYKK